MSFVGSAAAAEYAAAIVLQPDAKIVVAGRGSGRGSNGFGLARVMGGNLAGCAPTPLAGCDDAAASGSAVLRIRDSEQERADRVTWRWLSGGAVTLADFGDPTGADDYTLCIYDESSNTPVLRFEATASGGVACSLRAPCWQRSAGRFRYRDPARLPAGVDSVLLKAGSGGMAQAVVVARAGRSSGTRRSACRRCLCRSLRASSFKEVTAGASRRATRLAARSATIQSSSPAPRIDLHQSGGRSRATARRAEGRPHRSERAGVALR